MFLWLNSQSNVINFGRKQIKSQIFYESKKKHKLVWYPFHHKPGLTTIYEKETGWWILFDHFGLLIVIKKIIKYWMIHSRKKKD